MPHLLALLALVAAPPAEAGGVVAPPIRVETGVAFRQDNNPGLVAELGTRPLSTGDLDLELGLRWAMPTALTVPGPGRMSHTIGGVADGMFAVGPWFAAGPSLGLGLRLFRQQGLAIDETWMPMAGARASTAVVRARKWALALDLRATSDLVRTRIIIETARMFTLHPFELQVGLHLRTGLRRSARALQERP